MSNALSLALFNYAAECLLWYTEVLLSCLCCCRQTMSLLAVMGIGGWETLAPLSKLLSQSQALLSCLTLKGSW